MTAYRYNGNDLFLFVFSPEDLMLEEKIDPFY